MSDHDFSTLDTPEHTATPPEETPRARLVLMRQGSETDVEFAVNPPCTIGRFDPQVGPVEIDLGGLDEGVYVSRRHAIIEYEEGVWKVRDLGSSNGTHVYPDGNPLAIQEAELTDGTELAFGSALFVFRMASADDETSELDASEISETES